MASGIMRREVDEYKIYKIHTKCSSVNCFKYYIFFVATIS